MDRIGEKSFHFQQKKTGEEVFDSLAGGRPVFGAGRLSFPAFLEREIRTDAGRFGFVGREALREATAHLEEVLRLGLPGRTLTLLKGTQIGMTTIAVGLAIYCAARLRLNVGYFLPDQNFADRFDDTRVKPALRGRLARAMRDGRYKGVSPKGLKEFPGRGGSRFLYILGLRDVGNAISMPMDVLIRDEVDDIPPENLKWSNDRLDASGLALTVNLAMGRTPGAGIHAMYLRGDQRVWRVPCPGCGEETVLEEGWPRVMREEAAGALACPACGGALARGAGRWAAQNAEAAAPGHRSYRISQLAVGAVRLGRIAEKWRAAASPRERARFRCSSLALPEAGDLQSIGADLLGRLRGAEPFFMEDAEAGGAGP